MVDPADEFNSPYCYVGNKVIISIDPDGMNELTFNKEGAFTGFNEDDGNGWDIVTGSIEGREKKFTFNDFDIDDQKLTIDKHNLIQSFKEDGLPLPETFCIDINFESRVILMALNGIQNVTPNITDNLGLQLSSAVQTAIASRGYGSMDYATKPELYQGKFAFFLAGDKAYNSYDAGNYVWGYSMQLLGWNSSIARIGAHFYAMWDTGNWDTKGDQQAIINGYNQSLKQ